MSNDSMIPDDSPAAAVGDGPGDGPLFGKYEVGKLLGCGAFAKVYHARNVSTGQSVAIKIVSKRKIQKAGMTAANVTREISIMRRLRHPNIVRLFEVLATKTKIYFVMEYAKGGELFARISKGRFTEDLSRKYFQQLITAVGYCHARGVFHRDLKPENLLLDDRMNLKVSDFGLSATISTVGSIPSDGCGELLHTLCGTPAYVAPEILGKKGYSGAKVDVWSCGVVLFVLVAGYLPFNDANLITMYKKIYRGEFRCPKWTSPDLRRLLFRLLDSNSETRITIDEILGDVWFRKGGYKEVKNSPAAGDFDFKNEMQEQSLNAFDLISFSSGFDLSGFFDKSGVERFVSVESTERIVERVKEVAKEEKLTVTEKKKLGMKLEGRDGNFVMLVEIYRLNDELVVLEVREKEVNVVPGCEMWKNKLRGKLRQLAHRAGTADGGVSCA